MGVTTIAQDNLVLSVVGDFGITLASGKTYAKGQVVVLQDTGKFTDADVVGSGVAAATPQLSYDAQTVVVLAEDVDATLSDVASIGYTGEFNSNSVTLSRTQTKEALAGILQAKGIILKEGNK